MIDYKPILDYWFGSPEDTSEYLSERLKVWFGKDEKTDKEIRDLFLNYFSHFEQKKLNDWLVDSKGCLALIILLDQFSRNCFRDTSRSFSYDEFCQKLSDFLLNANKDKEFKKAERIFLYLPFEHSEKMSLQIKSVASFLTLYREAKGSSIEKHLEQTLDYAKKHYDIIKKFGRFPHRNKILQRNSSQEEIDFLKNKENSF